MNETNDTKDDTIDENVVLDSRKRSHAFCVPLRDVQYYCTRRVVGQYRLEQPWVCYKAVLGSDGVTVVFLKLLCPKNTIFVIGRDDMRLQGISYWIRVSDAKVLELLQVEADPNNVTHLDTIDTIPYKELETFEGKDQGKTQIFTKNQVFNWSMDDFTFNTRKMFGEGLLVQPSFSESVKVGESISAFTPDYRILQRNANEMLMFDHDGHPYMIQPYIAQRTDVQSYADITKAKKE